MLNENVEKCKKEFRLEKSQYEDMSDFEYSLLSMDFRKICGDELGDSDIGDIKIGLRVWYFA